jgi:hypothetical protein
MSAGTVSDVASNVARVINDRMSYVESLASSSRTAVDRKIADMMAQISAINSGEPPIMDQTDYPTVPDPTFVNIGVPDMPSIDFGTAPEPTYDEVTIPDMPALPTVYETDRMTLYDELSAPESDLVIQDLVYVMDLSNYLETTLRGFIDNGVSGLSTTVEQAIYDRAVSRKKIETIAMVTEVENYFAARGFSIPPGAMSGRLLEIQQQADNAITDINNDILRAQGELAFKGTWEAIGRTLELEKQKRDFFGVEVANIINKAKAKADNLMIRVKLMLEARESRLKNEGMIADDVLKRYQMIYDYLKTTLVRLQTNVEVYKTKSQIYTMGIETATKKWEAEVKKITTEISAKSDVNKTSALLAELQIKKAELQSNAYVQKYKSMNEKYSQLIQATVDAIKTVGTVYSQIASGALSAIHAGVSLSSSGSAGMSYSESKSDSISESRIESV